jgi:phosphate starvation-inducible protein PhoH
MVAITIALFHTVAVVEGELRMGKRKRRVNERGDYQERQYNQNPYLTKLSFNPDEYQTKYMKTIETTPVTFTDAPSGTGKTTLAVNQGFEALRRGRSQRIVYIRFTDDRYLKQGFLPGTIEEKEANLFFPFFDALVELGVTEQAYKLLRQQEQILLTTDSAMRGRNLKYDFVIIDEAQNARSVDDLQLLLTRIHDEGGKAVVIGHSGQQDNKKGIELTPKLKLTPFQAYMYHMTKQPFAKKCELLHNYRGKISQWADKIQESLAEL